MSNYKTEVENTEKLNNDISSAFTEINAELKKDDDLIAKDLFDIDNKIERLKKSRKKWAGGTNPLIKIKYEHAFIDLSSLEFKCSSIVLEATNSRTSKSHSTGISSFFENDEIVITLLDGPLVDTFIFDGKKWYNMGSALYPQDKVPVTDENKLNALNWYKQGYFVFTTEDKGAKINKWYAFE